MNHKKQTAKKNLLKLKLKKSIDYILTYAHGIDKTGKRNQKIVSNDIIQPKPKNTLPPYLNNTLSSM